MVGTEHVIECEVLIRYARFAGDSDLMAFRRASSSSSLTGASGGEEEEEDDEDDDDDDDDDARGAITVEGGGGRVSSRVLRWGVEDDYGDVPYDVVIGADVVTSLYDPVALARTFHALSGPRTRARLDRPHEVFEGEMERLYANVRKVKRPCSRLRSPNVFVIVADGKR
ncbi:hypothetical protein ACHAW5_001467 [Stephanodiscus triporus]|uniref:Uncharacterized protein n=1 Tax=Stephanodiscus triporus TaxID=2934178 RepID=A0ABD3N3Q6_9STRA